MIMRPKIYRAVSMVPVSLCMALGGWANGQSSPSMGNAEAFAEQMQLGRLTCSLDILTQIPEVWSLTPDRLDAAFSAPKGIKLDKPPYFQWMTTSRDRAVFMNQPFTNLRVDLKVFSELSGEEAVVDFLNGKINGITISLYNRGDSGEISTEEFQRRFKLCGRKISECLKVRPVERKADPAQGFLSEGWIWSSPRGMAMMEYNPEANHGKVEFLRLRMAPRDAKGPFAAALQGRAVTAKLSELPQNVKKMENGDVYIQNIPMVDQGQKGYCVVATTQRLFEYYGIQADQHQIAQVVGTTAQTGTSSLAMIEVLGKIDYRFKTRFKILGMSNDEQLVEVDNRKLTVGRKIDEAKFAKSIHRYIDGGIPVLWTLTLGKYPEEPPTAKQANGNHMRMIIGYNDRRGQLLFSDSWGAGHELKRMTIGNAYAATNGFFAMFPTVH